MVTGHGFFPETFDMYKTTLILPRGITLAAHSARTASLQSVKIPVDDLPGLLLPVGGNRIGHKITNHLAGWLVR